MINLKTIRLIVLDVDGTLTDGGIYYDNQGNEFKKFSVKDGLGIIVAQKAGINFLVLTGRKSTIVSKRVNELGISLIYQDVKNKEEVLKEFMKKNKFTGEEVGYIGDDVNDLLAMKLCSYIACPCDAAIEIQEIAHYVSPYKGGEGTVRDIIRTILIQRNEWNDKFF